MVSRSFFPYFRRKVGRLIYRSQYQSLDQRKIASASASSLASSRPEEGEPYQKLDENVNRPVRTFQRLPSTALLRGVILGQIFKSPLLFKPGLYLLEKIASSKSVFLNADKNILIRSIVFPLIYKQFCAGRDVAEVNKTVAGIKKMGYSGVILCYGGEVVARKDAQGAHRDIDGASSEDMSKLQIEAWMEGNLASLEAASEGDYVGVKYTGAGPSISQALKDGKPPPKAMLDALDTICTRAQAQNKQVWLDAEQQVYHPTIDTWTTNLMRKYNRGDKATVLTTIQAYLKSSRSTTESYLRQSQAEGWTLGIKLVRGAYITSDIRSGIHDTKPETDASYDSIVHDIITRSWPGFDKSTFPRVQLFLAGHNTVSIRKATTLVQRLAQTDEIAQPICYGQLQGMADDIGCELLELASQFQATHPHPHHRHGEMTPGQIRRNQLAAPRAYKCLTWGSVNDCLGYLVRRAVENQGAAERLNANLGEMKRELWRRVFGSRWRG